MAIPCKGPDGAVSAGSAPVAVEYLLLGLLALLWGSSYLFIKIALEEIPPLTLIAARVSGAALMLLAIAARQRQSLPLEREILARLLLQAVFNSIGAWTILAWGQQFVDAGLASVLNSTSPIFVFLFMAWTARDGAIDTRKLAGALLGILGVVLIVGIDVLRGLGDQVAGQIACLAGAVLYAAAAFHGRHFDRLPPVVTAAGTMLWATVVLVPAAAWLDRPCTLSVSWRTATCVAVLAFLCTGLALVIYFRLVRTIGALRVASQSYLRAAIGVGLGVVLLGEALPPAVLAGTFATLAGVVLINRPGKCVRAGG